MAQQFGSSAGVSTIDRGLLGGLWKSHSSLLRSAVGYLDMK